MVAVVVVPLIVAGLAGCTGSANDTGPVRLLVSEKVIPIGKLAQSAVDDGSIKSTTVPRDVAPPDRITDTNDIKCLVPSKNIPANTMLRRSMFVEPSKLGLDKGLTDQTARSTSCG